MKLCRYGPNGEERPAIVDAAGRLRDLSAYCSDIGAAEIAPAGLSRLAALDIDALPLVAGHPRLGPPVAHTSKFVCVGLNYSDHAAEAGMAAPDEPILFLKAPSAICGAHDPIIQPAGSTRLDWEVELGVIIGSVARSVSRADAHSHVAGYCLINDVSERAFQLQSSQWDKGKGCDSFGPVGPWLVTRDEVPDPQALAIWLDVNGVRRQDGNTRAMIFDIGFLVAYISRYMTLLPGDIIATGTPAGVGMAKKPEPVWLVPGDEVKLGIAGLGVQRHEVVAARRA